MELRRFLKKQFFIFLLTHAGITLSMGIIGCIQPPLAGLSHYILFMPFLYAFFCILPSFVTYSSRELSIKQIIVRKIIEFFMIELIALFISYFAGALINTFMCIAIMISVAVTCISVTLIHYYTFKADSEAMTKKIQKRKREDNLNELS